MPNAGCGFSVFGEEENVAAAAGSGEFCGSGPIGDAAKDVLNGRRVGAGIKGAVEFPCASYDTAETVPRFALQDIEGIARVGGDFVEA